MKFPLTALLLGIPAFWGGLAAPVHSEPPAPKPSEATPPPAAEAAPKTPKTIRYKPPVTGAPTVRGTGGTRGEGDDMPSLYVLAPEHEALTTQAQPSLFWFQSGPARAELELTLTEPKKAKPLLTLKGKSDQKAGIHSISMARHNAKLDPNLSYRWSVALVVDRKNRSKDIIASGVIKRVEAPAGLAEKIAQASQMERANIYAEAGFWYDALQSISLAIAAEPNNQALHRLRASLLEQGKLKEAAAAEKK